MSNTLANIQKGPMYTIASVADENNELKSSLESLGFIEGEAVKLYRHSWLGSPIAVELRGSVFAMRVEDASKIKVKEQS